MSGLDGSDDSADGVEMSHVGDGDISADGGALSGLDGGDVTAGVAPTGVDNDVSADGGAAPVLEADGLPYDGVPAQFSSFPAGRPTKLDGGGVSSGEELTEFSGFPAGRPIDFDIEELAEDDVAVRAAADEVSDAVAAFWAAADAVDRSSFATVAESENDGANGEDDDDQPASRARARTRGAGMASFDDDAIPRPVSDVSAEPVVE
jgi:hypothetical protein